MINDLKVAIIIQARMSSSRLPGKVLKHIQGKPMLAWVFDRASHSKFADQVLIATTTDPSDDAIVSFCREQGYPFYRGSLRDVLDRYYHAALDSGKEIIVRLTADCPLIDPGLIDRTIQALWLDQSGAAAGQPDYDFAANRLPPPWGRTYPIGLDVEVCTFEMLQTTWKKAAKPYQREHVMPYIYENTDKYRIKQINHHEDLGNLRWTVDTPEDLEAVSQLAARLPDPFTWLDVAAIWQANPEISAINAEIRHKTSKEVE